MGMAWHLTPWACSSPAAETIALDHFRRRWRRVASAEDTVKHFFHCAKLYNHQSLRWAEFASPSTSLGPSTVFSGGSESRRTATCGTSRCSCRASPRTSTSCLDRLLRKSQLSLIHNLPGRITRTYWPGFLDFPISLSANPTHSGQETHETANLPLPLLLLLPRDKRALAGTSFLVARTHPTHLASLHMMLHLDLMISHPPAAPLCIVTFRWSESCDCPCASNHLLSELLQKKQYRVFWSGLVWTDGPGTFSRGAPIPTILGG